MLSTDARMQGMADGKSKENGSTWRNRILFVAGISGILGLILLLNRGGAGTRAIATEDPNLLGSIPTNPIPENTPTIPPPEMIHDCQPVIGHPNQCYAELSYVPHGRPSPGTFEMFGELWECSDITNTLAFGVFTGILGETEVEARSNPHVFIQRTHTMLATKAMSLEDDIYNWQSLNSPDAACVQAR